MNILNTVQILENAKLIVLSAAAHRARARRAARR
jgi:hypothetical protein